MAERFSELSEKHIEFIKQQHLFFVGTAGAKGTVNVSPKGLDTLRIVSKSQVVWLNLKGSGNETSVHVQENGRMTLMFCSFAEEPLILRLYGIANEVLPEDEMWKDLSGIFDKYVDARQIFQLNIDLVQTSCGYTVPFYHFQSERQL